MYVRNPGCPAGLFVCLFFFFGGGHVSHGFSEVGSTERKLGSWERICAEISVFGAEIFAEIGEKWA